MKLMMNFNIDMTLFSEYESILVLNTAHHFWENAAADRDQISNTT